MSDQQRRMTDDEFLAHIEHCIDQYKGDISYMNEAVGLLVVSRYMGWRHSRLVSSEKAWAFALKVFGDPKSEQFAPDRTPMGDRKSVALMVTDKIGGFLAVLKRKVAFPMEDRRILE
jgi:hypothetical protein